MVVYTSNLSLRQNDELNEKKNKSVTMILGGDVMLGRSVMSESIKKNDFAYPFRKIAPLMQETDITFVNLENPIIDNCQIHNDGYKFCAVYEMLTGLSYAGVDIVSLANNHSRNYGEEGLVETTRLLSNAGIKFTGLDELEVVKVEEFDVGFLGFDFTSNEPETTDYQLIQESHAKVDYLVISVHWGVEYTNEPQDYQKFWAKNIVDNGADLIIGHHPHWVQSDEIIEGKPVFYSLGNLVFDQMWSEETKSGMVVKLTINELGETIETERIPTYMVNWAQPDFVN